MCSKCRNATFGYHITDRNALASIAKSGLSPLIARSGSWTASDSGSFARDRAVKLPGKIEARIADVVASAINAGLSAETVKANGLPRLQVLIDIPLTGSTLDNIQLDRELAEGWRMYVDELADRAVPAAAAASMPAKGVKGVKASAPRRMTGREAKPIAASLPADHYLVRLAESYEHWRSAVEEKITGQHVYFFVSNHKSVYEKYLKICGAPDDVAFLRVRLCNLAGHEPDDSDADAVMTMHTVLARFLESTGPDKTFMEASPPEDRPGSNTALWEAKGTWVPLV